MLANGLEVSVLNIHRQWAHSLEDLSYFNNVWMERPWGPASSSLRPPSNLLSSHNLQDHVLSHPLPPR